MSGDRKGRIEAAYNKLENLVKDVPGYKGYKEKEVRREADKLLRMQVARGLEEQRKRILGIQLRLTNAGRLEVLVILDRATMKLQLLIDRVKTASYGYAGLFDAIKVRETELDALYNFDAALLGSIDKIKTLVDGVAVAEKDEDVVQTGNALLNTLEEANTTFSQRQDVVLESSTI